MSSKTMGTGVGMGIHRANIKKVYSWLWHSWKEAQHEVPILRWVALASVLTAGAAVCIAFTTGGATRLELIGYVATAVLYALEIPIIFYLLFEVYRKHRTDAIYDSKRLADLIRRLSLEQIEAREEARSAVRKTFLMMPHRDEDIVLDGNLRMEERS